jgi:hypothetical protein
VEGEQHGALSVGAQTGSYGGAIAVGAMVVTIAGYVIALMNTGF